MPDIVWGATENRNKRQESRNMSHLETDKILYLTGCRVRKDQKQLLRFFLEDQEKAG